MRSALLDEAITVKQLGAEASTAGRHAASGHTGAGLLCGVPGVLGRQHAGTLADCTLELLLEARVFWGGRLGGVELTEQAGATAHLVGQCRFVAGAEPRVAKELEAEVDVAAALLP